MGLKHLGGARMRRLVRVEGPFIRQIGVKWLVFSWCRCFTLLFRGRVLSSHLLVPNTSQFGLDEPALQSLVRRV